MQKLEKTEDEIKKTSPIKLIILIIGILLIVPILVILLIFIICISPSAALAYIGKQFFDLCNKIHRRNKNYKLKTKEIDKRNIF